MSSPRREHDDLGHWGPKSTPLDPECNVLTIWPTPPLAHFTGIIKPHEYHIPIYGPFKISDIDDCVKQPCKNNGTCKDGVNSYTCTCQAGFTGNNCETGESRSCERLFFEVFSLLFQKDVKKFKKGIMIVCHQNFRHRRLCQSTMQKQWHVQGWCR